MAQRLAAASAVSWAAVLAVGWAVPSAASWAAPSAASRVANSEADWVAQWVVPKACLVTTWAGASVAASVALLEF